MQSKKPDLQQLLMMFPDWFLKFNEEEKIVSLALYRLLAKGKPVSALALVSESGQPIDKIEKLLSHWAGVYFNDAQEVIGYWGLSVVSMPHKFIVDDVTLYTWCAWDALFLPPLIQKKAIVESVCPISNEIIKLVITPEGVQSVNPTTAIVSFVEPPASEKLQDDVISHFCHYVHFINSEKEIEKWESEQDGAFIYLTPSEAFELGQMKNQAQYPRYLREGKS